MPRPKGSKNKPKIGTAAASGGSSSASGSKRTITVELTEDIIMRNFTASELLQIATRMIARGASISAKPQAAESQPSSTDGRRGRRRRRFSAVARAKMAEAQRQRWAKYRKQK